MSIEFINCIIQVTNQDVQYSKDALSPLDRLHDVIALQPQHRAVHVWLLTFLLYTGTHVLINHPVVLCPAMHAKTSVYGLPSLQVSQIDVRYFTGCVCVTKLAAGDVAVLAMPMLSWATRLKSQGIGNTQRGAGRKPYCSKACMWQLPHL